MLKKDVTTCMNSEANDVVDLNEDKSIETEQEIKVLGKSSRSLLFCKRMKKLPLHRCPLKDRIKNKTISY